MSLRNFLFAAVSSGSAVLMALVYFVAGRFLGVDQFGVFSYALAVSMIGEAVVDMGLHQYTIRAVAQAPEQRFALLRTQVSLKLAVGVVVVMLGVLSSALLHADYISLTVVGMMLLSAALRSWFMSVRGVLLGLESFGVDAVLVTGDRLLLTVAGISTLLAGGDVVDLAAVFLLSRVVTITGTILSTHRTTGRPALTTDVAALAALHRRARPLGVFVIVLTAYTYLDTIMLRAITTDAETGIYSAAYRIYEGGAYAASVLWAVITPRLSALWVTDRPALRRLARRSLLGALGLALPLAATLAIGAPVWTHLLLGAQYADSVRPLAVLSAGLPFFFCIWVLHAVAVATGQDRLLICATGFGLGFNAALNLVAIPMYGATGAAVATVVSEGMTVGALLVSLWPVLRQQGPRL